MDGITIASMIASESIRMVLSAAPIGPCGSRIFIAAPENGTAINGAADRRFQRTGNAYRAVLRDRMRLLVLFAYLNFGICGTDMRDGGSGAILAAFPMPLGSTVVLFSPPAFAGPGAIPLIGTFPDPT